MCSPSLENSLNCSNYKIERNNRVKIVSYIFLKALKTSSNVFSLLKRPKLKKMLFGMFCFTIFFFSTNQSTKLIVFALVLFNVFLYFFFFLLGKLTLFIYIIYASGCLWDLFWYCYYPLVSQFIGKSLFMNYAVLYLS